MSLKYIIAVVRASKYKSIVSSLYAHNIPGISVSTVRGFGERVNAYSQDILEESVRLEIFVSAHYMQKVIRLILDGANTGMEGDGVLAVLPVEEMFQIRDFSKIKEDNMHVA